MTSILTGRAIVWGGIFGLSDPSQIHFSNLFGSTFACRLDIVSTVLSTTHTCARYGL